MMGQKLEESRAALVEIGRHITRDRGLSYGDLVAAVKDPDWNRWTWTDFVRYPFREAWEEISMDARIAIYLSALDAHMDRAD